MIWVVVATAVAILIALAIMRFGPGRTATAIAVVLVSGLALLIWYAEFHAPATPAGFPRQSIRVEGFTVTQGEGGKYRLDARIHNDAKDVTLSEVQIGVSAEDCVTSKPCDVIGEDQTMVRVDIPPGQARDVTAVLNFGFMRPRGELRWSHRIARATQSQ